MNLASIQFPVFNPYGSATIEIYISGCNRNCLNCCNFELQNFSYGKKLIVKELIKELKKREKLFEIISIVGGDLLCQKEEEAKALVIALRDAFPIIPLWLFTGEDEKQKIPDWCFNYFNVIKYGKYIEKEKQKGFPASKNQKIWKNPFK